MESFTDCLRKGLPVQKLLHRAFWSIVAVAAICGFMELIASSAEKEHAFNEEIRANRCALMGENTPKDMEPYCENLN